MDCGQSRSSKCKIKTPSLDEKLEGRSATDVRASRSREAQHSTTLHILVLGLRSRPADHPVRGMAAPLTLTHRPHHRARCCLGPPGQTSPPWMRPVQRFCPSKRPRGQTRRSRCTSLLDRRLSPTTFLLANSSATVSAHTVGTFTHVIYISVL